MLTNMLNGWVYVGLIGKTEIAFARRENKLYSFISSKRNNIDKCLKLAKEVARGKQIDWPEASKGCLAHFEARPLSFAEYAAIGGDL
jgi:galactokinase